MNAPMRRIAIVSPYFPPSSLAGVHRARLLARHLPDSGWTPVVVCVHPRHHEEQLDPQLASLVPAATEKLEVAALPARLTRRFGVGDIGLRAYWPLRRAVHQLARAGHIDAVLITGSPYYPMLMAPGIARSFALPVILDFQDPWVSRHGETQPLMSKQGLSHFLARHLEPRAVAGAAAISSVSEQQNHEMAARYPAFDPHRFAAIPIGGDPADFAALAQLPFQPDALPIAPGRFNLSYVGTFLPRSEGVVRVLFRALRQLRDKAPAAYARLSVNFIGTSNQPNDHDSYRIRPIASAEGVADVVHETPRRLPYFKALACLAKSDALLLLGSDEPHYTASKIYPALMSGKPYLSVFHSASSAHGILKAAGGGLAFAFADARQRDGLEASLCNAVQQLVGESATFAPADPAAYAAYTGAAVARQFASLFNRVCAAS